MKNLFLVLFIILFTSGVSAQTWKKTIYGTAGNKGVRTIRLKPAAAVTIRTLKIDTDTLKYSTAFTGKFDNATHDSLTLRLSDFSDLKILGTGMRYSAAAPGSMYVQPGTGQKGMITLPISDIHFISYRNNPDCKLGDIGEGAVFASLFVLLASPFVCIDYGDGSFNAGRYKYWALGSTAVLFCSFSAEALFNHQKSFQFTAGWPAKKQKVWSFSIEDHNTGNK